MAAIEVQGLAKQFGETRALDGIDLSVPQGTVLGLLGPNGAGKTTAVRVLATLLRPDSGTALVGGYDVVKQPHQVRQLIGLTGQYASVDETLTGTENLVLVARLLGIPRDQAKARARELLADFRLADAGDRAAKTYSGGMRRRLDLATSLVGRPRILFLDEPTTGLDPVARLDMWDLVRSLVADGVTVLLTTQYLDEADELADDLVIIDHGRVIASGSPDSLKAQIGAQSLVVRPINPDHLDAVVATVAAIANVTPEVQGARVTATVTDPSVVPAVVRRLDDQSITFDELTLRTSSLDEVFITLTGRRGDDADDATAAESQEASA